MANKVSISTLPYKTNDLGVESAKLKKAGVDFLHCDIMDGIFVNNRTFMPEELKGISEKSALPLDVHLMIQKPLDYLEFCKYAEYITFHYEVFGSNQECLQAIQNAKRTGAKVGLAINLMTNANEILPFLNFVDLVLVMSVNAGHGGQAFEKNAIDKIKTFKKYRAENVLDFLIEVDGGINANNARECVVAGADILVSGSFVANSRNYEKAVSQLKINL